MPEVTSQAATALLYLPVFWLVPALVVVLALAARTRRTIGRPIAIDRPMRALRLAAILGPQLAVLAIILVRRDVPEALAAESLFLGLVIGWLSPGSHDAVCGDAGVQRGWDARRFEDLEEWRLTGQHLRFRLAGEWTSVPCPPQEQPRVREKLLAVNGERESRFRD